MTEPISDHPNMDAPLEPPVVATPVQPAPQQPDPHQAEGFILRQMNGVNAVSLQLLAAGSAMRQAEGGSRDTLLVERATKHLISAQRDLAGVLFTALKRGAPDGE